MGSLDKVFLTEREVFMPLANLSWDCKSLGGCVNSMVDWGRAHVWSVERPPLVPKGEKKLEARLRESTIVEVKMKSSEKKCSKEEGSGQGDPA